MQIEDFPCECGHSKMKHLDVSQTMYSWGGECVKSIIGCYCEGCIGNSFCSGYKPDNLKYLDQLCK
jgi:hypothetical protein